MGVFDGKERALSKAAFLSKSGKQETLKPYPSYHRSSIAQHWTLQLLRLQASPASSTPALKVPGRLSTSGFIPSTVSCNSLLGTFMQNSLLVETQSSSKTTGKLETRCLPT